jgi:4-amino-4-deoxy-L-arabinose transferase-like glycosyltransferase
LKLPKTFPVENKEAERVPTWVDRAAHSARGWRLQPWHVWLLVIGLLIRLTFCFLTDKESSFGGWDGKEYYAYGQSLLALRWDHYPRYFNSIRPPFYPLFLTPFLAINDQVVWHIQVAQSLLGVFQAIILAKIAGRWAGRRAGNWALVIALFHPFLIYYSAFVLTETVFTTLLWLGIACLERLNEPSENQKTWLTGSAITLALACLTRPALQPFLVVAALWLGWRTWRFTSLTTALKRVAYFTTIVSVLLLPWMIGNLRAHGEFTLAPGATRSSYALSNSPEYLRMYEAQTKQEYYETFERLVARFSVESKTRPEVALAEAQDFRRNHTGDWWRLQLYKFKHFWTPWLNPLIFSRGNFLLSVATITPLFVLAAVELLRRRSTRDPFLVLLLGLVAVGYLVGGLLFHVQIRYRFPFVDVSFIVLTASLLGWIPLRKLAEWRVFRRVRFASAR